MRKLGQHFLKNTDVLKKIASSLEIKDGDNVIEIGPGHGELTDMLKIKNQKSKIIAIEKDKVLAESLRIKYKNDKNIDIVEGDALKILPGPVNKLQASSYKLAGNIPYYITGHLFRVIGDLITNHQLPITLAVLLIQKEVAERLASKPPRMNLLAASVQIWADVTVIKQVPAKYFAPPPEVDSAVIKLETRPILAANLLVTNYYKMLRILFKQPRKTILNNLADGLGVPKEKIAENLKKIGINPLDRPQNLEISDLTKLSKDLYAS